MGTCPWIRVHSWPVKRGKFEWWKTLQNSDCVCILKKKKDVERHYKQVINKY